MQNKIRKIQLIYFIYWCLLAYTIAALVFWYISLNEQNSRMTSYKLKDLKKEDTGYYVKLSRIRAENKMKTTQFTGEGITFFLVILAGAIFIFRSVRRQLKQSVQQQNFIMAITHELKTPIAVAQLNLETLLKRKLDESQQHRLMHNTLQETVRLNTLCNNMLLSSQIDAGGYRMTYEELNLSELVTVCAHEFVNRYPQKKFIQNIQADVFVQGDELMLQIAVNNLVDNAIKYSSKGSAVTIRLVQNENIILSIEDEGSGISDSDKKKVFDKFYRAGNAATKSAKGTGLGLYLTFRVIKAHHGNIEIKDNKPGGTIFLIHLKPS